MNDYVRVKLESAGEVKEKIMSVCLKQCESPDNRNLLRIGSLLGDFANNLRSALNYTMRHYVDNKLKPQMAAADYKKLKGNLDFPWSNSKAEFDNKPIISHIKMNDVVVYEFLERIQPYHPGNEWLRYLMQISNKDKHEIINEIGSPGMIDMVALRPDGTPHNKPGFFGDKLMVKSGEKVHIHPLPCYYYPNGAFASKDHKWILFFIVLEETKLGLIQFIERVPSRVEKLIDDFNMLL